METQNTLTDWDGQQPFPPFLARIDPPISQGSSNMEGQSKAFLPTVNVETASWLLLLEQTFLAQLINAADKDLPQCQCKTLQIFS